jgi:hypothetical protein
VKATILAVLWTCIGFCVLPAGLSAKPLERQELASEPQVDRVGDVDGTAAEPSKALGDTVWIADWTFDDGAPCNDAGWVTYDGSIWNDGSNYWTINADHSGTGGIIDKAAVLAKHDLSWVRDGYGNNWDYSIILKYQGVGSTLSFDYLSDSEPGFDFVTIEADSAGASEARVDLHHDPSSTPAAFRSELYSVDGPQNASVTSLALPDFGVPATVHEVYIRFTADGGYSDEDGGYTSDWNAGLVVDNIVVTGGLAYSEDFEGALNPNVTLANTARATGFGDWARLYPHITDNDRCTENTTCAWLLSDPTLPAYFPNMAFGPGGFVIRNWLDDIFVSPWVSLASTPNATHTLIYYRRFPGNNFSYGNIVQNWSMRSKIRIDNTDTSVLGDSIDAVTRWAHASNWNSLGIFAWITSIGTMSAYIAPEAREVQIRFRHTDWQYIGGSAPPTTLNTGPGPFTDRVRIGRRILSGPVFSLGSDARSQAQDCFPTYRNAISPGEHFSPTTDIFGTCAFSRGADLAINATSPNLVTGDSITVSVTDVRGAGGVSQVRWYGVITRGPHAGKCPAPYSIGAYGIFQVTPDSARAANGAVIANTWTVDLDDTYFRGGDQLKYYWVATDAAGGRSSAAEGLTAANFPPASPDAAELVTGGLFEVDFLPTIDWSPSYLARVAFHYSGDLDPTPEEIAESQQQNCILYYAAGFGGGNGRRSGDPNRTSFMYTLDRLGYRDHYDVYDHEGYGNTNNQLGGRATVEQCSGYALVIHDTGRGAVPNIPDGIDIDSQKIDQCQWYRDYLAQGLTSAAGVANLWLIGEDNAFEKASNPLLATDFGLASITNTQSIALSPEVTGQASFAFATGDVADFTGDDFTLNGGCPAIRDYDGALGTGTAVVTHRYTSGSVVGPGAVVMNANSVSKWNTIWMGFGWFDIVDPTGHDPASGTGAPDTRLARTILDAVLPNDCQQGENPTDTSHPIDATLPGISALRANVPNPFNPTTTIRFDLAHDGHVRLRIYDVAGRIVATLVDEPMTASFGKSVLWNGLDASGQRAPSGVYFSQLVTEDLTATRKMVLLQ